MAARNKVEKDKLLKFLSDNSFGKFYVEYEGFLANHLAHAAIALYEINDCEEHFDKYLSHYVNRLEPPDGPTSIQHTGNEETVEELLGKEKGFYKVLDHYKGLYENEYGGSIDDMIQKEFPKLSPGILAAAFHPLIHIGYGLKANAPQIVLEGFTYLHYSYLPPKLDKQWDISTFGKGELDLVELLQRVGKDDELYEFMKERSAELIKIIGDEKAIAKSSIMAAYEKGDELMNYVNRIKIPNSDDDLSLFNWLVDQAVIIYANSSNKNDFFLLHCVTGSWALKQIAPKLMPKDRATVLRDFICGVLAIYLSQGRPKIELNSLHNIKVSWEELRKRLLDMDVSKVDEHDFKLFQVCHDQWLNYGDEKMEETYKKAVLNNLDNEFLFYREDK